MKDTDFEHLRKRIGATREDMKNKGIDVLLVEKKENKNYLSMFYSTSFEVVITADNCYLLTDFRYIEAAEELRAVYKPVETTATYSLFDFLNELGGGVLGIEFCTVTLDFAQMLREKLTNYKITESDGIVEKIRVIKDDSELECIKNAEAIGDKAFSYILDYIKPGATEKEVALKLELKMRELGAESLSFDTICVSGERTSLPHGHPTDKKIANGDFVTLDFGCVYNGYCSDMTRTVAVGNVSQEQRDIYDIVLKAQMTTCDAIKAGMTGREVDQVARGIIADAGYADCFGHGLGHGVGLEIHEAPTANPRSDEVFVENMLITIEPGIYLPKKFGVRIEDLSIVTNSGIINLSYSEKNLIIL